MALCLRDHLQENILELEGSGEMREKVSGSDAHPAAAASAPCGSPSCLSATASRSPRWSSGSLCPPPTRSIQPSRAPRAGGFLGASPPLDPLPRFRGGRRRASSGPEPVGKVPQLVYRMRTLVHLYPGVPGGGGALDWHRGARVITWNSNATKLRTGWVSEKCRSHECFYFLSSSALSRECVCLASPLTVSCLRAATRGREGRPWAPELGGGWVTCPWCWWRSPSRCAHWPHEKNSRTENEEAEISFRIWWQVCSVEVKSGPEQSQEGRWWDHLVWER